MKRLSLYCISLFLLSTQSFAADCYFQTYQTCDQILGNPQNGSCDTSPCVTVITREGPIQKCETLYTNRAKPNAGEQRVIKATGTGTTKIGRTNRRIVPRDLDQEVYCYQQQHCNYGGDCIGGGCTPTGGWGDVNAPVAREEAFGDYCTGQFELGN